MDTLTVRSPSGGHHIYFNGPNRANSAGRLGDGLDVRSWHGFVVAPGSTTPKGAYTLVNDAPVREAPESLIARLDMPRERSATASKELDEPDTPWAIQRATEYLAEEAKAPDVGSRNAALFSAAAQVKDWGVAESTARDLIESLWNTRLGSPLDREEIEKTVGSAYANGQRAFGCAHPEAEFKGVNPAGLQATRDDIKPEYRPENRFALVPFSAVHLSTAPEYCIKGLLPAEGLAVVWGAPKVGKSFFVVDAAMHVALGWKYRGRRVKQGTVVYCALEGISGFSKRAEAFRQAKMAGQNCDGSMFKLMPSPLALVSDCKAFIQAIEAQLVDDRPAIIVIDTLNRSFEGSESEDRAMTPYVRAATAIIARFRCLVILVHHCGYNGSHMRGSTVLSGALDTEIKVDQDSAKNIVATVMQAKDSAAGLEIVSKLEVVGVGVDDDGDPIESCVVQPAHALPKAAQKRAAYAPTLMTSLEHALVDESEMIAGHKAAPLEAVREQFKAIKPGSKDRSNIRSAFNVALRWAEETGAVRRIAHLGCEYLIPNFLETG